MGQDPTIRTEGHSRDHTRAVLQGAPRIYYRLRDSSGTFNRPHVICQGLWLGTRTADLGAQQFGDRRLVPSHSEVKGGVAPVVHGCGIGSMPQQKRRCFGISGLCGEMQRRTPFQVARIRGRAACQQQ